MSERGRFPVHPWSIVETELDLSELARSESLFSLSNAMDSRRPGRPSST